MQLSGAFSSPGSKIPTGGDPKDSIPGKVPSLHFLIKSHHGFSMDWRHYIPFFPNHK
jgi:hypothetical protein